MPEALKALVLTLASVNVFPLIAVMMLTSCFPVVLADGLASTIVMMMISSPMLNPLDDETVKVLPPAALVPVTPVLNASVYAVPELTVSAPSDPSP